MSQDILGSPGLQKSISRFLLLLYLLRVHFQVEDKRSLTSAIPSTKTLLSSSIVSKVGFVVDWYDILLHQSKKDLKTFYKHKPLCVQTKNSFKLEIFVFVFANCLQTTNQFVFVRRPNWAWMRQY